MKENLYNEALERDFIGQAVNNSPEFRALRQAVSPEDFSVPECAAAWRAACSVYDKGATVNISNVYADICEHEGSGLATKVATIDFGTGGDLIRWAVTIAALAAKRRIYDSVIHWTESVEDPLTSVEELCDNLNNIANAERGNTASIVRWSDMGMQLLVRVQDLMNGKLPDECATGFSYLDSRGGLKAGNLNIIAGRTSNGKTALAMAVAVNTALAGNKVAVYSMEMTLDELATRIASMVSRVPCKQIDRGPINAEEFSTLYEQVVASSQAPILFESNRTADVDKVIASIRKMHACEGVRVVVLDYIQQLTSTRHRDKRSLVSDACVRLKNLAVELGITIIALSQLARENPGGNHLPLMSQLKEAGEIENSADNVYMVYRAELYDETYPDSWKGYPTKGTALVLHTKARSGAIGSFLIGFEPECVRYYDRDDFTVTPSDDDINWS